MSFEQFKKEYPGLIIKKRGRWGTYHFDVDKKLALKMGLLIPADYQSKDSFVGDSEIDVYEKIMLICRHRHEC